MAEKSGRRKVKKAHKEPSFEVALERLEEIAGQLESGDLTLEQSIKLAEEGFKLSQLCEKELREAEGKIEKLVERMGTPELEPLDTTNITEEQGEEA